MKHWLFPHFLGHALCVFAFLSPSGLRAQEAPTAVEQATPYTPLTLPQKYSFSINKVFSAPALFAVTMHASLDQAETEPHSWGQGSDAFATRFASRLGRSLLRQNLAFGVRAMDHEDPRYFGLGHGGRWQRVKYAIVHTFIVRKDDGGSMPAYSLLVSDYGMPFIAQQWRPARFRTVQEGFCAGSIGLSTAVVSSLAQEFWPDIKKRVQRTRWGARFVR